MKFSLFAIVVCGLLGVAASEAWGTAGWVCLLPVCYVIGVMGSRADSADH